MPTCAAKETIVRGEEHVDVPLFCTDQMEGIELAETKSLKRLGARRILGLRNDKFIREREERLDVVAPVQVRVAADFDLKYAAAHPSRPTRLHESKNALDGFCLVVDPCLALIIRQAIQATPVQVDPQTEILPSTTGKECKFTSYRESGVLRPSNANEQGPNWIDTQKVRK